MNTQPQTPRIHTNGETFLICANQAGFEELQKQITYLLENEAESVTLNTSDANDISTICLVDPTAEPVPQSFLTTLLIMIILLSILLSSLVGFGTILGWLF